MADFEFKIDGRKVSPSAFTTAMGKDIKAKAMKLARAAAEKKIRSIRCPVHGGYAKVVPERTSFKITGCCDKQMDRVKKAFR